MTDRQIKAAIDIELTKKGLTPVDGSGPADLLIGHQAAVDTEKQFTSYDTGGDTARLVRRRLATATAAAG